MPLASPDQDMFVVSITYTWACLYIALHSVVMVKMITQRTALPSEPDPRNMASDLILNLLGSSARRLEGLITTYTCHSHICGSERLNPRFAPS